MIEPFSIPVFGRLQVRSKENKSNYGQLLLVAKKVWASIADKIVNALEQRAEEEGRSRSDLIAYLLEDAMKDWEPQVVQNSIDIEAIRDVVVALATDQSPKDSASIYRAASELGLTDDQLLALQKFKKRKNGNGVGNGKP